MERASAPRPTAALVTKAARLSAKQRDVFRELQARPEGMQVSDLSRLLGMHVNTVRGHLDELMALGVVARRVAASPGRGRPSHVYTARAPRPERSATALIALVEVLTSTLTGNDTEKARELGAQWAQSAQRAGALFTVPQGDDLAAVTQAAVDSLRDLGFDPELRQESSGPRVSEIALRACPFVTEPGKRPTPEVCAMHLGCMAGRIESHAVRVLPFNRPGECSVLISRR